MPKESLASVALSLSIATRDLRETMDDTQEMYHHLFVRSLDIHNTLQTILAKLKDAELGEYTEST